MLKKLSGGWARHQPVVDPDRGMHSNGASGRYDDASVAFSFMRESTTML